MYFCEALYHSTNISNAQFKICLLYFEKKVTCYGLLNYYYASSLQSNIMHASIYVYDKVHAQDVKADTPNALQRYDL